MMRESFPLTPLQHSTVPSNSGEIQPNTTTDHFFAFVKGKFYGKHDQVWDDVASEFVTEHGIMQVSMFGILPMATVRDMIEQRGGKAAWAASIECLSGQKFAEPPPVLRVGQPSATPLGTSLFREPAGETSGGYRAPRFAGGALGLQLQKSERLQSCIIPQHLIVGAFSRGVNFNKATDFIKLKEQTQICEAVWTWVVYNYANVGNCRILFAHLEKQIEALVSAGEAGTGTSSAATSALELRLSIMAKDLEDARAAHATVTSHLSEEQHAKRIKSEAATRAARRDAMRAAAEERRLAVVAEHRPPTRGE